MKKILTVCFFILIIIFNASAQRIFDIYATGGISGGTWIQDYVVLSGFTPNQNLVGMSLQYRGSGSTGTWTALNLTGSADASGLYRIWLASNATGAPWTPQQFSGAFTLANSGTATNCLQLALMNNTTTLTAGTCPSGPTLIDLVGYIGTNGGTTGCYENTPAPSDNGLGTQTRRRKGGIPGQDTGNNSVDFEIIAASTPLPVELVHFTARNNEDKNILEWATASEVNSQAFEVERSQDGATFMAIGQVKAVGIASNYTFTDASPLAGMNYYRLKQVDNDGKFDYSPMQMVKTGKTGTVVLYPNPVSAGIVNLSYEASAEETLTITVIDALGREVLSQIALVDKGENTVSVSTTAVSAGVYLVKISNVVGIQTIPMIVK
jgi:hypothetical protein